jgi:DNA-3-methyladenine glycosylase
MNYSPPGLGPQDPGVIDLSTPLTCVGDLRRGCPRGTWSPQAGTIHAVSAEELAVDPLTAAQRLLGAILWSGPVGARLVEVEAYGGDPAGPWHDPAAHSGRGRTPRNAVMFGPPGHLYCYLSYGMHTCVNIISGPDGVAGGVLLRAAEIVAGHETVRGRRPGARTEADLAKGPGNLGSALGIGLADYGTDVFDPESPIRLELGRRIDPARISAGPRVGVSSEADRPWRVWLPDSPAVSTYRRSPRAPRLDESA